MGDKRYLNKAQLKAELEKCLHCASKPCMKACPVSCCPYGFIEAAKSGDMEKAARLILEANPLGQTCGLVCPDHFCMKACLRAKIDAAIRIPKVQATILEEARSQGMKIRTNMPLKGKKVAVVGAGPAGMAAVSVLRNFGYAVEVFEKENQVGGAMNLIPDFRLQYADILKDWDDIFAQEGIVLHLSTDVAEPQKLLDKGFDGVIVAIGESDYTLLGIEGEEFSIPYSEYLKNPEKYPFRGNVAVVGGGAVAVDCAVSAKQNGAEYVEMVVRRRVPDMRITVEERKTLLENQIDISSMTRVCKIEKDNKGLIVSSCKTKFVDGKLVDEEGTLIKRGYFDAVILALGSRKPSLEEGEKFLLAGDCKSGSSTVVEAVASGKDAAERLHQILD